MGSSRGCLAGLRRRLRWVGPAERRKPCLLPGPGLCGRFGLRRGALYSRHHPDRAGGGGPGPGRRCDECRRHGRRRPL